MKEVGSGGPACASAIAQAEAGLPELAQARGGEAEFKAVVAEKEERLNR